MNIRAASDEDAPGLISLIGTIWRSYPGVVFDVDRELPELKAIASVSRNAGGHAWVAERGSRIVGSVAIAPAAAAGTMELSRLYVAAEERRQGLARRLLALAENWAFARGARRIELWTDTRFAEAHRFYAAQGYLRGEQRHLQDLSRTSEFRYRKDLAEA